MDDLRHHFYATVGYVLDQARLGCLTVHLELADGRSVKGVPDIPPMPSGGELDDTGYPRQISLDDTVVPLEAVLRATIEHPDAARG